MKYAFSELRKIGKDNPASAWGRADRVNEWSAPMRMQKDYLPVYLSELPFKISPQSKFFAIGSCFARGIENALRGAGMDVASYEASMQAWPTANESVTPQGVMNKYNPGSILKEIEWSEDFQAFPKDLIVDISDTASVDLSLNPTLKLVANHETFERHEYLSRRVFGRIWEADVVFITLGLIEVWTDELTGLPLNGTPPPQILKQFPERFTVRTLTTSEIEEDVRKIVEKLNAVTPAKSIFLTVSPVPLMRTFTGNDIIVANTTSKTRLRAVASEIVEAYDNVAYFPSYEIVMNSKRESAWESDMRHVKGEMTQFIMRTFIEKYIG